MKKWRNIIATIALLLMVSSVNATDCRPISDGPIIYWHHSHATGLTEVGFDYNEDGKVDIYCEYSWDYDEQKINCLGCWANEEKEF